MQALILTESHQTQRENMLFKNLLTHDRTSMQERGLRMVFIGFLSLVLPFLTTSCAVNPVTGERQLMLLSEDDELSLGRRTDAQVLREYGTYDDPNLTGYINNVCQRLGRLSHRPNITYHLKILDTPVVNAFAVPGGYVYLTRGILASLNNEAELAGVVGHEIGHITARHSAQQYSRAQLAQIGMGVGMVLSETLRQYAGLAEFGVGMLFLRFSRDNEREADDLGVEYASKAGYDATHMANFFETLERMHPGTDRSGLPSWFSTHPNPVDRRGTVRRRATEWRQKLGLRNLKVDRDGYLKRIDGMVFGEDPRQGYVEKNVFYYPGLCFRFPVPENWKLQNTRTIVRMTSKKGDAVILFTISSAGSPEESARTFIRKSGASALASERDKVNGLPSHRLIWELRTRQGPLRGMSYFIRKDNRVYVFHGLSPMSRFNDYVPTFKKTMRQFKNLTDPTKLNVKPARIRIRPTRASGSLRQGLRVLGTPKDKLEELAILNGKRLEDPIPANTLLKLIEK